jgi:protein SCO1/2
MNTSMNPTVPSKRHFLKGALSLAALPSITMAAPAPSPPKAGPRDGYFPNSLLQTHDGRTVRFYDDLVRGKTVIFNMMYAVCTRLCPVTTANLIQVQQALGSRVGRDIFMYSLTLRPEFDTPAALRDYVRQYDIGPGWTFLTGSPAEMDLIRRRLGFYDVDPVADAELSQHTGMIRFGDERRDRWAMSPAASSASQIARAIVTL